MSQLRHPRRRAQRGFTLIEMMVALVLFAVITVGMMSVAVTMTNGYRDQEVTIATETSTRAALEFMSQGLRGASPGVSDPYKVKDITNCPAVNNAFKVDSNQLVVGLPSKPDAFTVVMPAGQVITSSTSILTPLSGTLDVSNASEISVGDQLLVTDHVDGSIVRVTAKTVNQLTLAPFGCATVTYPVGSTVIRVVRARFSIGFLAGDNVPMLFMDPDAEGPAPADPIAEGIEDMQIAVGIDDNLNNIIDPENNPSAAGDEWHGNNSGDILFTLQPNVRAVRLTLVARTAKQATGVNAYVLPAIEDRPANAATDNFRRRILSSVLEVRNLGGSP